MEGGEGGLGGFDASTCEWTCKRGGAGKHTRISAADARVCGWQWGWQAGGHRRGRRRRRGERQRWTEIKYASLDKSEYHRRAPYQRREMSYCAIFERNLGEAIPSSSVSLCKTLFAYSIAGANGYRQRSLLPNARIPRIFFFFFLFFFFGFSSFFFFFFFFFFFLIHFSFSCSRFEGTSLGAADWIVRMSCEIEFKIFIVIFISSSLRKWVFLKIDALIVHLKRTKLHNLTWLDADEFGFCEARCTANFRQEGENRFSPRASVDRRRHAVSSSIFFPVFALPVPSFN